MISNFLASTGLSHLIPHLENTNLNTFVEESFSLFKSDFSPQEIKSLYIYLIPELGPDRSCAVTKEPAQESYSWLLYMDSHMILRC